MALYFSFLIPCILYLLLLLFHHFFPLVCIIFKFIISFTDILFWFIRCFLFFFLHFHSVQHMFSIISSGISIFHVFHLTFSSVGQLIFFYYSHGSASVFSYCFLLFDVVKFIFVNVLLTFSFIFHLVQIVFSIVISYLFYCFVLNFLLFCVVLLMFSNVPSNILSFHVFSYVFICLLSHFLSCYVF